MAILETQIFKNFGGGTCSQTPIESSCLRRSLVPPLLKILDLPLYVYSDIVNQSAQALQAASQSRELLRELNVEGSFTHADSSSTEEQLGKSITLLRY